MGRLPGLPYRVISSYDLQELRRDVNESIEHGYEPQGGIGVSGVANNGEAIYFQAMYRSSHVLTSKDMTGKVENFSVGTIEKPNRQVVPFIDEEFEKAVGDKKDKKK